MNLNGASSTTVGAHQICPVAEVGVVECVVAGRDRVFVARANGQPVARVFVDLEGHLAGSVAFLLQRGLQQTEVVVVAFGGFYGVFADYADAGVL